MCFEPNKVVAVLDASTHKAPDMTHALCELGNGNMGSGIIALWQAGWKNGFIQGTAITSVFFLAGISIHKVVSAIREDRQIKRLVFPADQNEHFNSQRNEGGRNCA